MGSRLQEKVLSLYISNTDPFKISLFQKGIKKAGDFNGKLAAEKSSHYIPVAQTPSEFHPSKKFPKVWRI